MELDDREHWVWGAGDLLAVLRGAADGLQVLLQRVGDWDGDRGRGKEMKKKAMDWKKLAEDAIPLSQSNLDKMIEQVLLSPRTN